MSNNALKTQGTLLKVGDGADPEVFTTITERVSISGPGGSTPVIDCSDLDSDGKEKRPGLQDEGQLNLKLYFKPGDTQHAQLRNDKVNGVTRNYQLVFTDAGPTVWQFAAFPTSVKLDFQKDGVVMGDVTLEITGSITES